MSKRVVWSLAILAVYALFAAATTDSGSQSSSSSAPSSSTANPKISDEDCMKTLNCWGERHSVAAAVRCRRPVELLAKNDFQWTDGFLEPKFSHYRWANEKLGVITFIGDKIKFQNGFG